MHHSVLYCTTLCQDLGNQCVDIHQRTARINSRLGKLREAADNYDPKQQKIRELHHLKGCTKLIASMLLASQFLFDLFFRPLAT